MNPRLAFACVCLSFSAISAITAASAQEKGGRKPIPLQITPFYSSEGPKIDVGAFSEKLAKADAKTILDVIAELRKQEDKLRVETMFVAAVRLYDLGHKDESVYWYYAARYRSRLFFMILDKEAKGTPAVESLRPAYLAFAKDAGEYIEGYAYGELDKLDKTLAKVQEDNKKVPAMADLYPKVKFIAADGWNAKNTDVSAGFTKMIEFNKNNRETIREIRKKNGVDGKY